VDFEDFFMFADAFGITNPAYDLDDSGRVDFGDFFVFADNFGRKDEVAKLIVLAEQSARQATVFPDCSASKS
tara:strand:+ start:129 stop:344 length:216 start_codon:yes stop_codon:yes gene_type:complete